MNTKLLKQKILDLAIRGKLTQQLKTDGTAADLLKEISFTCHSGAKRSGAIESKKSKDLKPIIPIDKSEAPFEIPPNWEWVRLGDLCNVSSGKTPSTSQKQFWNGNVLWVTSKDVKQKYIDSTQICLSDLGASSMQLYPPKTMIIVGRSGILRHTLPVAILKKSATVNQDLKALVFKDNRIVEFVYAVIKGMEQHLLHEYKKAGTTVDNLNFDLFLTAPIPLPPLAEQQRIVAKIEEAFAEIDAIEKNKELLKTHIKQTRQKILDLAIHGKLVPQNKSDEPASVLLERITCDNPHYEKLTDIPFEIPESWEWVKLGDLVEINPKNKLDDNLEVSFVPMNLIEAGYSNRHAQESRSWKDVKKGFTHFAENDVALAKISPCFENKKSAIMKKLKNGYGAGTTELFVFRPLSVLLVSYLLWIVKSDNFIQAGTGNFSGVVGQQRLSRDVVENYPIPLPPVAEQKRIVDRIEEIFKSLDEISLHLV